MEQGPIEQEIIDKAREWADDYGEDFLVELIGIFLDETPNQLAQLRCAADGQDTETVCREAHSLKSSSANLGAVRLAAMAQRLELAGRSGKGENLSAEVQRLTAAFDQARLVLEALRQAPTELIRQER